jgi:hypothetical protein
LARCTEHNKLKRFGLLFSFTVLVHMEERLLKEGSAARDKGSRVEETRGRVEKSRGSNDNGGK